MLYVFSAVDHAALPGPVSVPRATFSLSGPATVFEFQAWLLGKPRLQMSTQYVYLIERRETMVCSRQDSVGEVEVPGDLVLASLDLQLQLRRGVVLGGQKLLARR